MQERTNHCSVLSKMLHVGCKRLCLTFGLQRVLHAQSWFRGMTLIMRARSLRLLTRLDLDVIPFARPLGVVFPIAVCCLEWIVNPEPRLRSI